MKVKGLFLSLCMAAVGLSSCQKDGSGDHVNVASDYSLEEVAKIMTELPIGIAHVDEVFDAVSSSSYNGYDEEYMFSDLLTRPGEGVGNLKGAAGTSATLMSESKYSNPLRNLLSDYFADHPRTKSGGPEESLRALMESGIQIYWPYSEEWDGESFPIVTFDPENGQESNIGYELVTSADGTTGVKEVIVDEDLARQHPVWVINRNDDSEYSPISVFSGKQYLMSENGKCLAVDDDLMPVLCGKKEDSRKVLKIRAFQMMRNYDSWFAGASEFWIKCGAVNGFRAATEEDLAKYTPSVTDCMVVVKRSQLGRTLPLGIVMLTDFTDQMENIAFLITEDDGGTIEEWKCEATVKVKSKSWGVNISIPYHSKDDIVWRGQLSRDYLASSRYTISRLGDVSVTFEME